MDDDTFAAFIEPIGVYKDNDSTHLNRSRMDKNFHQYQCFTIHQV